MKFFLPTTLLLLLLCSCTKPPALETSSPVLLENTHEESCSYLYFLLGNRSELYNDFEQALAAYQRALECSPDIEYLQTKIPLMLIRTGKIDEAIISLEEKLEQSQERIGLIILLANLHTQQENYSEAIKLYDKALQKDPGNISVSLRLGLLYFENKQYTLAQKTFQSILKKDPESYNAHLYLAYTHRAQKEIQATQQHYNEALRLNWSTALAYEIAEFYYQNKMFEQALQMYEHILNFDQGEEQAFFYKIHILSELKQYDKALTQLQQRKNYSIFPENLDLNIANILIAMGEKEKGITKLEQISEKYFTGNSEQTLALLYYEDKNYPSADKWAAKVSPESEIYEQALLLRVQMFIEQKQYKEAIKLLTKYIESADAAPAMYSMLATLHINVGQSDKAESVYKEGLELYPADSEMSYDFALLLDKQKRFEEALAIMQEVLEVEPENANALNFIGYTWADNNMNLEKALEYTKKAAQLEPDNGYIRDSVGWAYYRLEEYAKAVQELELAVQLAPKDPHIHEHLADAYLANQQPKKAYDTYLTALKLHQDEEKKNRVQKKIDELKKQL